MSSPYINLMVCSQYAIHSYRCLILSEACFYHCTCTCQVLFSAPILYIFLSRQRLVFLSQKYIILGKQTRKHTHTHTPLLIHRPMERHCCTCYRIMLKAVKISYTAHKDPRCPVSCAYVFLLSHSCFYIGN